MHDALIIETPTFKPDHQMPTPITANMNNNSNTFIPFQERQSSIGNNNNSNVNNNNKAQAVKHPQPMQPNNTRVGLHKSYAMNRSSFLTNNNPVPSIIRIDRCHHQTWEFQNSPVSIKDHIQIQFLHQILLLHKLIIRWRFYYCRNFSLANNNSNQALQSSGGTPAKKFYPRTE